MGLHAMRPVLHAQRYLRVAARVEGDLHRENDEFTAKGESTSKNLIFTNFTHQSAKFSPAILTRIEHGPERSRIDGKMADLGFQPDPKPSRLKRRDLSGPQQFSDLSGYII